MMNINQLGKTSEIIGKILFYLLIVVSIAVVITFNLSKLEDEPETSILMGSILGNILAVVLIYFLWKLLFRPIYRFNKIIELKISDSLLDKEFKSKWILSLICSLIFGLLFIIGTFGISFILMIPHYILLYKSKKL